MLVNGCFWHRHADCKYAYFPKSRVEFWNEKFADNVRRDRATRRDLRKLGWKVLTVWECETRQPMKLANRLEKLLSSVAQSRST